MTELICETIGALGQHGEGGGDTPQPLSFKERMAIDTAALIYMQELGNQPPLQQLALRVGINRNKLSEGFRRHFGCSPHAYSKRMSMDWARSEERRVGKGCVSPCRSRRLTSKEKNKTRKRR